MGMDDVVRVLGSEHLTTHEIQTRLKGLVSPRTIYQNVANAYHSGRIDREKIPKMGRGSQFRYFVPPKNI